MSGTGHDRCRLVDRTLAASGPSFDGNKKIVEAISGFKGPTKIFLSAPAGTGWNRTTSPESARLSTPSWSEKKAHKTYTKAQSDLVGTQI
jgi:hypothetical protein